MSLNNNENFTSGKAVLKILETLELSHLISK